MRLRPRLIALALLACTIGGCRSLEHSAPRSLMTVGAGVVGQPSLAWDMSGPLATVQGYQYQVAVDGASPIVIAATCSPAVGAGFTASCLAPLPSTITPGSHLFAVTYADGTKTSPAGTVTAIVNGDAPPPPDPCVAQPLTVMVSRWPNRAADRSQRFDYTAKGPSALTEVAVRFGAPGVVTLDVTDIRGCTAMVARP